MSYKSYLRCVGRKSVSKMKLRTKREAGDVEIVPDPKKPGEWKLHVHKGEEPKPKRLRIVGRAAA